MKNLNKISNILKDSNFRVELNQNNIDDSFLNQKNFFSLESIVYIKMAENYEIYVKKIKDIHKNLIKYKEVTEALTEAFIRKEKVELDYNREKNADFSMGNDQQKMKELTENYRNVEIQFFEELSNYHKNITKRNKINNHYNFHSFVNHNSLYTIMKNNKLLGNSPLKCMDNVKNINIIKNFIKFSGNISKTKNKKINDEVITAKDKMNIIENKKISERTAKNNDIILKIKDSLDDNLKHILNFSYENFLNKESERDCN
jgi:hypothetical protein